MDSSEHIREPRPDFLAGGGEMGRLMRAFDWAATPLGSPETWPQSLRTTVSTCLNSRFPILIWWGPELVMLYNDAYRPVLGAVKHPAALGQRGRDCWPEIWDVIGPMLEGVVNRGEATWSEDQLLLLARNGYTEECYFTFSYSPVRDESGGVAGVFTAVTETTERVLAERRLATLRDLALRTNNVGGVDDACRIAATTLSSNGADIPAAMIYLLEDEGHRAVLRGASGIAPGTPASPAVIELASDDSERGEVWPLSRVIASGREFVVQTLEGPVSALPGGGWPESPRSAVVLPIQGAGENDLAGFLVAAVSPRRALDEKYYTFFEFLASAISTAVASARAREQERDRAETLAELDRAKTQFFSNISHEFRTPLTLLLGPMEEALRRDDMGPDTRRELQLAQRNAVRLLKLVNALLDFSRAESGRASALFQPTALAEYTAELVSVFRSAIERGGVRLTVNAAPLAIPVYVDREMWEKIVFNLLSNAFKHTFEGQISVRVTADAQRAQLEVTDTGVGIPPEQLLHIFERFHRVPGARSRTHEGTGIGLALTQELVRLHGGAISVASTVGEGTVFTVSLPLGPKHLPADQVGQRPEQPAPSLTSAPYVDEAMQWLSTPTTTADESANPAQDSGPESPTGDGTGAHILVADDNADMREYISRLLIERGLSVEAVADGRTALDSARARVPDLILTDVMMPGLDGFQLLDALRADRRTKRVPVVLLSARAGEEARIEGMQAGADDYVVKPFAARELQARVERHVLNSRRAAAERATGAAQKRQLSAVDAERSRLQTLFSQAPAAIAVLRGPDHVYETANEEYLGLVGHREVLGKPIRVALPELEGQGIYEMLDGVYRTGTACVGNAVRVMVDSAGEGVPVEQYYNFVYQPLVEGDGSTSGVFVHAVDVTEQVTMRKDAERLQHEAEQARGEAQAANRSKSEFLAMMSHELRTPLNAILGYAQLLQMNLHGELTEAQRKDVERIEAGQQHLTELVEDILTFAKIETGHVNLSIGEVRIEEVLAEIDVLIIPTMTRKGLRYQLQPCDPDVVARADHARVRQIVINLLTNAAKFTATGGEVVVACEVQDSAVCISVRDTGTGIPADKLDLIFEPFVQGDGALTRAAEGTGLGLAISRELARAMRGELQVESTVGEGSTFTLTLPRQVG